CRLLSAPALHRGSFFLSSAASALRVGSEGAAAPRPPPDHIPPATLGRAAVRGRSVTGWFSFPAEVSPWSRAGTPLQQWVTPSDRAARAALAVHTVAAGALTVLLTIDRPWTGAAAYAAGAAGAALTYATLTWREEPG